MGNISTLSKLCGNPSITYVVYKSNDWAEDGARGKVIRSP